MPTINRKNIQEAINRCKNEEKETSLNALEKHVAAFGQVNDEGKVLFSRDSIANSLKAHGETKPQLTGCLISMFNASVAGQCPFGEHTFSKPGDDSFGHKFHLGTFRFYNEDGSIDENKLQTKLAETADKDGFIALPIFLTKLREFTQNVLPDPNSGRHPTFFSSIQITGNQKATAEAFKILACKWVDSAPCVHKDLLSLFFTDTPLCLKVATELGLPVIDEPVAQAARCVIS